jgi:transcriptional regulator with PAS, ATPase and Fis domain
VDQGRNGELKEKAVHTPMVGEHPTMRRLRELAVAVGRRECTALIRGESGTGKELLARQIHLAGPRATGPFVPVDCSTLRDSLLESQLFGHVRGAFTGAACNTLGFFRAADGGTIFLDEIGELLPEAQARLLRCLQERAVVPLGTFRAVPVNVRIIAATHRPLAEMVRQNTFRIDLYFRLNVVALEIPPLRNRKEDIPLLAEQFLGDMSRIYDEPAHKISPAVMKRLTEYDWPGNVRELRNVLERACALTQNATLTVDDLPSELTTRSAESVPTVAKAIVSLAEAERQVIASALRANGGNQSRTALALQVERHRLSRMIRRHGLQTLLH